LNEEKAKVQLESEEEIKKQIQKRFDKIKDLQTREKELLSRVEKV